ncbi:replication protein [Canis familiaris papillomavirus 4]|uniref:Replication protein E1 n=2 Tax=Canis familiaris papillomavirus 4 TaxID=464980 RepID=A9XNH4_9PAPI|nr:replication protein [Canis familiaris papillomavirus 4]ABU86867.1 replication protein [Canis familiaris papillomavirus 4]
MEGDLGSGTDPGEGTSAEGFLWDEADCSDMDTSEDESEDADLGDFIDDSLEGQLQQGNSRELLHQQTMRDDNRQVQYLKRKYGSPKQKVEVDLSPRLKAITISPPKQTAKRRLFAPSIDSGLELSGQNETVPTPGTEADQVDAVMLVGEEEEREGCTPPTGGYGPRGGGTAMVTQLMKASNLRATQYAMFKRVFGVSFTELTRAFRSNKTCNPDWVVVTFGVHHTLYAGIMQRLEKYCEYVQCSGTSVAAGYVLMFLMRFTAHKNRDTIHKLMRSLLNVSEQQILADPPKIRSTPAALYWYRNGMSNATQKYGPLPEWVTKQTLVQHQTGEEAKFTLATMVQWAYDNDHTEESDIAYHYALLADVDANAAAWLNTNSQAKHLKDCATMVRHYKRAIMSSLTMSEWIHRRIQGIDEEGDWKEIGNFLRYQHVEVIAFLGALRDMLKRIPKKTCICIVGPPNTGKSAFCLSLLDFFGGKVISFTNYKSQFWLMPLADTRLALLDDATRHTWDYMDEYMRNALDGNQICLDLKHRAPLQIRCPPLLVTSNIDIRKEDRWRYLVSRVYVVEFKSAFPFNENGEPVYQLTKVNWKSFFTRLWSRLDLSDQEDEGEDGDPEKTFRCDTKRTNDII